MSAAVQAAETIATALVTIGEMVAARAADLAGDQDALDVLADAFAEVASMGVAIERHAPAAGRRLQLVAGGAQ